MTHRGTPAPEHADKVHLAPSGVRERDGGVRGRADADEHALAAGAGAADAGPDMTTR